MANSTQSTWWDNNYLYRQQITIVAGSDQVPANYFVKASIDTSSLQTAGKVRSDRKDWRIVYYNPSNSTWTEIARYYAGTSATWFKTQTAINANTSDSNYYAYYGYSSESTTPQTFTQNFGLDFNGSAQHVSVSDSSNLRLTTAFTIEAWVYVSALNSGGSAIVCKGATSASPDYLLSLQRGPGQSGAVSLYDGTAWRDSNTGVVSAGTWTHVAVTYNNSNFNFYVNGSNVGTVPVSGSIQTSTNGLQIGTQCNGISNPFNGAVDEVRIWNVARTRSDIQNNKDNELVGNESGLVAYWKLDDASSTTAADSTSDNNNGTLVNGPNWIATRQSVISLPTINDATTQEITSYSVYYNGYGSSNYQIGQAYSSDNGLSFTKNSSNPVLSKSASGWDSNHVKDPWVIKIVSTYYLYYAGYDGTNYQIGLATSPDGLSFTRHGSNPILPKSSNNSDWDGAGTMFPAVFYDPNETDPGKVYKMFYSGKNTSSQYQIGLAYSPDGITWTKYSGNPIVTFGSAGSWEAQGVTLATNPIKVGSTYYFLYDGLNPTNGKWQTGLVSFTNFYGTYTKYSGNPVIARRSNAVQSLTAQTNSGTTTVTVSDTSVFQVNEPVFLRDTGSNDEINRIASINSSTQLTLTNAAARNYPINSTIRSWMNGSNAPRTLEYSGGTWKLWFTPFQPYTPSDLMRETTGYATSSDGISWTIDYTHSPPIPYTDNTNQWDGTSSENPAVVVPSQQLASSLNSPSNFSGSANSSTAITWSWTDNSNLEFGFKVHDESGNLKQSLSSDSTSWQETSLSVNAQYIRHVHAYNNLGNSDPSNEYRLYTLANTPGTPTVGSPSGTSLKVTLDTNSNPSSTEFAVYETSTGKYVQSDGTLGASAVWQTYTNWGGASGQTVSGLAEGTTYTFKVKARNGDAVETALSTGSTGTPDGTAPAGGSIIYTDGYHTTASVSLTTSAGTDSGSGINTSTRTVQRKSATLSNGACGSYGSFATITPTGTYPNFTDSTVVSGNCYQYQYLVSDNASNQATYTSSNTVKVDMGNPTTPGSPSTTTPTNSTSQTWSWTAATDAISGVANYAWRAVDNVGTAITNGTTSATSVVTSLTQGIYSFFVKATDNAGNTGSEAAGAVTVNTQSPTGSISINSGASYTNTTGVTLTLSASDDSDSASQLQMEISNSSDFSGASYESYITSKSWTLPTTDGAKTVYARFKDSVGNVSSTYSASTTLDTTAPDSFDLDSPGDNSYTNSERPTFRWKAASTGDATSGLSKYKLEVDNGDSGSFTIDSIPTSGTSDIQSDLYVIHFDGFNDSDNTNNYISVYTKSSSTWGSDNNDGKLKEGKRNWKVTAYDNAGNTKEESRSLLIDRSSPNVEINQLNSVKITNTGNTLKTTDTAPTIYGKITDSLVGDKTENKISSGPKSVEVKVEKLNIFGLYDLNTLATVNLNETYWTSNGSKISDNSQNSSDKYSNFEFTPTEKLPLGNYKITLTGKDNAGNTGGSATINLDVITFDQFTTTEEKKIIKEQGTKEPELTKQEVSPTPKTTTNKVGGIAPVFSGSSNFFGNFSRYFQEVAQQGNEDFGQVVKSPKLFASRIGDWLSYSVTSFGEIVLDKEPTKITDVKVAKLNKGSVIITWKTNHLATSKVNYGLTKDFGKDVQSSTKVHEHKIEVTGLEPATKYYYEVMSQNKNYVYDANHEFTTPKE